MDLFTMGFTIYIIFILICIIIIFIADSDILTFLSFHFGAKPQNVYDGKVVWITGASSGIGASMALELAKCNAKLILSARREEELIRVQKECLEINPGLSDKDVLVLPLNMTDTSSHEPAFKKILKHFGKLDVLVSNAGRSQRANWHEIDLQVDKEMFELNVFSVVNMNRIVLRYFLEKSGGQLAIMSSIAGKFGVPNSGTYTGSKYALHGYFEGLRSETFGKKIDITILCPGPTFSGFLKAAFTDKSGETFNQDMKPTDKRMKTERCAYLCLVAMANKLNESWISIFPLIPLVYLFAYQPYIASKFFKWFGCSYFQKVRDSRDTMENA